VSSSRSATSALSALDEVPVEPDDCEAAVQAMRDLAYRPGATRGEHKVKAADALIAASAVGHDCGVLHYDKHYERLAEVLPGLVQVWVAPRDSL
jgi:predicted nucleic acid-binding protein